MSIIFESVTTFISNIKDRREFVTSEKRLVTGGKGFVISRREYIVKGVKHFRNGQECLIDVDCLKI